MSFRPCFEIPFAAKSILSNRQYRICPVQVSNNNYSNKLVVLVDSLRGPARFGAGITFSRGLQIIPLQ